jgi:poly-gamma-glutamate capsule biosynthesis protein CapA/YwtB (metallophosphatase superfamily)
VIHSLFSTRFLPLSISLFFIAGCQSSKPIKDAADGPAKSASSRKMPVLSPYDLGKKALDERQPDVAVRAFSECVLEYPDDVECHWELGWSFFLNFEYGKAKAEWEIVARLNPKREGLDKVLDRANTHLDLQVRGWALRSQTVPSFNTSRQKSRNSILLRAVGDTMLGTNFPTNQLPPENSSPLAEVTPFFDSSDINFVNYEGTLCDQKSESKCEFTKGSCFAFRSPTKFAPWLKQAGFTVASLANNHTMDFGGVCQEETEKTMESQSIAWSGRKDTVARFEKKGVKFSLIAFHSADHTNSTRDLPKVAELVKAEKAAKRTVIISFHGGAEGFAALNTPKGKEKYFGEDRGDVRAFAHAAIDAGADLVIGHGPHVVRGMEFYKKKLIAYSLGNFATYGAFSLWGPTAYAAILEVELSKSGDFLSGRLIPVVQHGQGVPAFDATSMALDTVRYLSRKDFGIEGVEVAQDGTLGTQTESRKYLASFKSMPIPRKQNRLSPAGIERSPASDMKPGLLSSP